MITLTMECERCGKEVSHDMSNETLNQDAVRKFGYVIRHDGKKNILICLDCENAYEGLQDKLEGIMKIELCSFFNNCEEEGKNGETKGKPNSG